MSLQMASNPPPPPYMRPPKEEMDGYVNSLQRQLRNEISMKKNEEFYNIRDTIVVDSSEILGTDYSYDGDREDTVLIEVNLKIPKSLFQPIKVAVNIPVDYITPSHITSRVTELQIPIVVDETSSPEIQREVTPSQERTILGMLKSVFVAPKKEVSVVEEEKEEVTE